MNKLEEIFKTEDRNERLNALLEYARTLRINTARAMKPDGEYSEHELAVLIFDVERNRRSNKLEKTGFLIGVVFFMAMVLAAIYLFVVMSNR